MSAIAQKPFSEKHFLLEVSRKWTEAIKLGRWDNALSVLDRVLDELSRQEVEQQDFRPHIHVLKSVTYSQQRQWRLAVKSCVEALKIDPQSTTAWGQLGSVLLKAGKVRTAASCFQRELELAKSRYLVPDFRGDKSGVMSAYVALANTKNILGKKEEAMRLLREALEVSCGDRMIQEMITKLEASDTGNDFASALRHNS